MTLPRSLPRAASSLLGAAPLLLLAGSCAFDPPVDERPWALTPATDLNDDPAVVEIELEARPAAIELLDGTTTSMWTYNGLMPGPLVTARVGDRVIVHLSNALDEDTTIHWHGLRVPAAMDGVETMQSPVPPGGTFTYDFTVPDAELAWYHPHIRTDVQVERGLQAPFVVRDAAATAFGKETIAVLDDVLLDDDGSLAPFDASSAGMGRAMGRGMGGMADMNGRIGNTILVNGHRRPRLTVHRGEPQLLRLVNTANARTMRLVVPGHALTWIGTDGGLLAVPRAMEALVLSPGERADVLLTLDDEVGAQTDLEIDGIKALHLEVVAGEAEVFAPLPERLAEVPTLEADRTRTLVLGGMGGGMGGGGMMGFTINGERWPDVTPLRAAVGDVETWSLENNTGVAHPFHLHGNRFQVQSGPEGAIHGWKDNVLVPAHSRVQLAVSFDGGPGRWMFHCHILEHAEGGMMGELDLVDGVTP